MAEGLKYNIVYKADTPVSATVFRKGRSYVAAPDHPNFKVIVQALEEGHKPKEVVDLFDTASSLVKGFRAARNLVRSVAGAEDIRDAVDKVKVDRHGRLFFDGEEMHGVLAEAILAYYRQGHQNFVPLVRFLDKVLKNPNPHSREHLYQWLRHLSFNIDDDGDILGYKGVLRQYNHPPAQLLCMHCGWEVDWEDADEDDDDDENDVILVTRFGGVASCGGSPTYEHQVKDTRYSEPQLVSLSSGPGKVNGVEYENAQLPNNVGDVVEMGREQVTFNPEHGCAPGLHVGTLGFATSYGNVLIEVKIDPRDVVSVPTDCDWQKLRVCRYKVIREVSYAREGSTATLSDSALRVGAW